jgi:hypothetical protein
MMPWRVWIAGGGLVGVEIIRTDDTKGVCMGEGLDETIRRGGNDPYMYYLIHDITMTHIYNAAGVTSMHEPLSHRSAGLHNQRLRVARVQPHASRTEIFIKNLETTYLN